MTEQDLHDYNKWLTEVWSKQHSNIPFMKDAPNAYLKYRTKQLTLTDVVLQSEQLMQSCSVCGMHKHPVLGAHCKASNCPNEH